MIMAEVRPYVSKRQRKNVEINSSSEAKKQCLEVDSGTTSKAPENEDNKNGDSTFKQKLIMQTKMGKSKYLLPRTCVKKLKCHENVINHVRWNNDLQNSILVTASMDSSISLIKWCKGDCVSLTTLNTHSGAVKDVRWSYDNKSILSGGYDKFTKITDAETGKEIFGYKLKDFVTSVLYHSKLEDVFLSGTSSNGIYAFDSRSGKEIHHYKSFFGQVQDIIFHPNGETFFSAAEILKRNSMDKAIIAWDFKTTAIVSNQISQEAFGCSCLRNHPVDPVFLAQYGTGYISIFSHFSPYKLNKYKRFEGHQTAGFNIGFSISQDGSCVTSGDREGKIHIYDYASSRVLKVMPAYSSACMDVAYHPAMPNVIASCSWDGEVSIWQ